MENDLGRKVTIEELECLRCSHRWWPKINDDGKSVHPGTCPKCRSPYWEKPIERKSVSESRKKK